MSVSSLGFLIEEAGRNIRRNGLMSVAALSTVTIAMAVLGGALFALYRLHQFADTQPRQFEIEVFMKDTVSLEDALDVKKRIEALSGIAHVGLFTKEQALAEWQMADRKDRTNIADALSGNPFPDRLDVRLVDPAQTPKIAAILRDPSQFDEVEKVLEDRETLDQVLALSRLVRDIGGVAAILLFLATALVIQNTIRLTVFARRREIRIMQLVGATPGFIRFPMVLEGIFYGVLGSALASGIVLFVVYEVSQYVGKFHSPLTQTMPPCVGPGVILGALVGAGALVGWAGSSLSVRRFLRRI